MNNNGLVYFLLVNLRIMKKNYNKYIQSIIILTNKSYLI